MMHGRNLLKLLALTVASLSAGNGFANGFRLADQDAAATARGEAFVATADNPSAIYYNPAGITQLTNSNVRSGIYGIYLDPSFRPSADKQNSGYTYSTSKHFQAAPQFFLTHKLRTLPASYGLGIYAPYGGSMSWPPGLPGANGTGFRTVATKGELVYLRINPVVAYQILPSLSIAAGAMVDYAKIDLEQGLRYSTAQLNFFKFSGDGWSLGYNAGLRWQPVEQISLGATFRSATDMTFDGHTDFEQQPVVGHRSAHMSLIFPWTAVAGISYRPTPKWNLEFDADYTDWSSFDKTTMYQSPNNDHRQNFVPQNFDIDLAWQSSWMYEFGVTRYFDNGWHVSAGYVFDQNSVPDNYYTPLAADLDRHFFSLGTGFKGRCWSFDAAYQLGYGPAHNVTGSIASSNLARTQGTRLADGTYDFISHAIMLTWGLRF